MEHEPERSLASLEAELRRSRDRLRIVFDNLPEGLVLLESGGRILAANSAFCRGIVGRRPQDVVGSDYRQLWAMLAAEAELLLEAQSPAEVATPLIPPPGVLFSAVTASWRVMTTDTMGQRRWYSVERVPTDPELGPVTQCLERWHDITSQEELQRRLLLHDQLSSLGRLAASVAHEVGNPLQSAMGCLELCGEDATLSERAREYLELALGELDRMGRTMESLRNLYRPPQPNWEPVDLNELIFQVLRLTKRQLERARIHLELELDETLPPIVGQSDGLRQVFLNLVLNAQQAMPEGGVLAVSSRPKATDRLCQVTVRDTGIGMSPEQLLHLFEPFRSSKSQGVGLGLYLTRQIVDQHAGHMEVQSLVGVGTIVTVLLPWSEAGPPLGRM
ncbi:MAG: two-component system sensor histidine kinase NtrB [Oscillochloridaceae bacterium umkhey_bin13]